MERQLWDGREEKLAQQRTGAQGAHLGPVGWRMQLAETDAFGLESWACMPHKNHLPLQDEQVSSHSVNMESDFS